MSRDGEAGQTTEEVRRRVEELGWWYHHFELPSGVLDRHRRAACVRSDRALEAFRATSARRPGGQERPRRRRQLRVLQPPHEAARRRTMLDGRARRRIRRPGDVRLRTVRSRSRGRVRGRSRVLPDDRRAVRLRPLPRTLLSPEVSGPRARPAGRDDEGADGLQLAHPGRPSGAISRGGNRALHARQDAPLRRDEIAPEPRGPGPRGRGRGPRRAPVRVISSDVVPRRRLSR